MDITTYSHLNIRMSTRGKRPLRNLTPNDKVRAIQRIHNGETKASVSRDIGVPESTLRGWCKNEQKLRFMCRQLSSESLSISELQNPPEKRAKFNNSFDKLTYPEKNFTLNTINNTCINQAILEKIALNELLKSSETEFDKFTLIKGSYMSTLRAMPQSDDVTTTSVLSLLHSNIENKHLIFDNDSDLKIPLPLSNCDGLNNHNMGMQSNVKNESNDAFESQYFRRLFTNYRRVSTSNNDTNNNKINSKQDLTSGGVPGTTLQYSSVLGTDMPRSGISNQDDYNNNIFDWCKAFNASLNFLTLAAAAASIRPQQNLSTGIETSSTSIRPDLDTSSSQRLINSLQLNYGIDTSRDSYDSEPEDLSIRSTLSKISSFSPSNSRSQSPTKMNDIQKPNLTPINEP